MYLEFRHSIRLTGENQKEFPHCHWNEITPELSGLGGRGLLPGTNWQRQNRVVVKSASERQRHK